jgi:hypothetical protein
MIMSKHAAVLALCSILVHTQIFGNLLNVIYMIMFMCALNFLLLAILAKIHFFWNGCERKAKRYIYIFFGMVAKGKLEIMKVFRVEKLELVQ